MIWFNDISISDIAPVKIVDILVSPIQMTPTARQRPCGWGADFVRMTGGTRTVTVEFALLLDDMETRQNALLALSGWARSEDPGKIEITGHEGRYLEGVCTALPEPSIRQWWESKLRITFTCFDPFWKGAVSHSQAFSDGALSLFIPGSAEPEMSLVWTNTAVSDWTFTADGRSMTFEDLPAGAVDINLNRQTASVNGESIMSRFVLGGGNTFIRPRAGRVEITCTTTGSDTPTLVWRERWV